MCKICGCTIEKGVHYTIKDILKLPDGKERMRRIAQMHFVGEKVMTIYKGFAGTTDVESIEDPGERPYLFLMKDKNGRIDHFSEGFNFEILNEK